MNAWYNHCLVKDKTFDEAAEDLSSLLLEREMMKQINANPELRAKADVMVKAISDSMGWRVIL